MDLSKGKIYEKFAGTLKLTKHHWEIMRKIVFLIAIASALISCGSTENNGTKTIRNVERISVESPEGTVPRLPYQVWVTYNDGTGAYRQVRWENSALATEHEQSDKNIYPAGTRYKGPLRQGMGLFSPSWPSESRGILSRAFEVI